MVLNMLCGKLKLKCSQKIKGKSYFFWNVLKRETRQTRGSKKGAFEVKDFSPSAY